MAEVKSDTPQGNATAEVTANANAEEDGSEGLYDAMGFGDDEPEDEEAPTAEAEDTEEETPADEGLSDDEPDEDTDEGEDEEPDDEEDADLDTEKGKGKQGQAEPPPDSLHTVVVDGKKEQVTYKELKSGYSRTQVFTRKTMEAAETRKKYEGAADQLEKHITNYEAALKELVPKEPDWEKLRAEDPQQYLIAKDQWNELQAELSRTRDNKAKLEAERNERQAKELGEKIAAEQAKLLDALPQWKRDPKVAEREIRAIQKGMKDAGFTDEELASLHDARAVLMIRDALLYRQGKSKTKPKLQPVPKGKTLKPGSTKEGGPKRAQRDADRRFRETGSVEDAAKALEEFID
jgi:hypothetical protein